jgi:hypothetical protein
MKKILLALIAVITIIAACKKPELAGDDPTGEGLVPFSLQTPSSGTNLVLNAATPNEVVDITWTPARPGLYTAPTYRWIASLRTGSLDTPLISIPSNNSGKDPKLTLTYKNIDDALKAANVAEGARVDLQWSVEADNGSTKLRSQDVFNISFTRFKDGVTPFQLLGPVSSTNTVTINPSSTSDMVTFNWQRAHPGDATKPVTYEVYFSREGQPVTTPLFVVKSNNNGADTLLRMTTKALSDSLNAHGITDMTQAARLTWTVKATSGTFSMFATYPNTLYLLREVNLFLVGGDSPIGWDPTNALQFIQDQSRGGVYYIYTYLTAGNNGFKLLAMKADWGAAGQTIYGEVNGSSTDGNNPANNTGNLTTNGGGNNIATPAGSGVYRITVDLGAMKYYVQKEHGRMGFVGGGTAAGWNPGAVFPAQAMGFASTNLFVGITNVQQNGEFKMLDNSDWPNGNLNYTRDYEDGGNGKLNENGGPNFMWTGATGNVRFIWDYRDVKNPKYIMNTAAEMRVVGDGMLGVNQWDPGTSPQMTYTGNGKWQITLNLIGGKDIKFVAGNAWGAFDYEDASGGVSTTGTARKISWDGGPNFKTPAASGSYTIILDEYAQTVTIN